VADNIWQALGVGEGTGWEPSGAQNLDEGRLGHGVDGTTDGTGVGVDGTTGGTRAVKAAGGDLKESYILGRAAPSQRSPLADSSSDGVDAQWPQSRGSDDADDASSTDGGASFDGAKFKEVLLEGPGIHCELPTTRQLSLLLNTHTLSHTPSHQHAL